MNIFIAGSCVTRDAFTSKVQDFFEIKKYIARYSLARLTLPPASDPKNKITEKITSKFQQRILTNEITNVFLKELLSVDFDYMIIDCVDERFGLVSYEDTFITYSDELKRSKIIENPVKIAPDSEQFFQLWEKGLLEILKLVDYKKIIINNVYWTPYLDNGEKVSSPQRIVYCNGIVSRLYNIAKKYIPPNQFVDYPQDIFVADSKHKWGKSPFHYTQDVYDYLICFLNSI